MTVPDGLLKAGSYYGTIGADIKNERIIFAEDDVISFEVFESGDDTLAERHKRVGLIAPLLQMENLRVTPQKAKLKHLGPKENASGQLIAFLQTILAGTAAELHQRPFQDEEIFSGNARASAHDLDLLQDSPKKSQPASTSPQHQDLDHHPGISTKPSSPFNVFDH